MAKDVEHFIKYLSGILDSSVENSLFSSAPHFNWVIWNFEVSFLSSLYIWGISPLSNVGLVKIFSHSLDYLSCLVDCIPCFTEASQFQEVPFTCCCSQCLWYWCYI